jgi:hypothetical protein
MDVTASEGDPRAWLGLRCPFGKLDHEHEPDTAGLTGPAAQRGKNLS